MTNCRSPCLRTGSLTHCRAHVAAELLGQPGENPNLENPISARLLQLQQHLQHAHADADNDRANGHNYKNFNQ